MNPEFASASPECRDKYRWSLRTLILGILGICLLTLYPFQIDVHSHPGINPFCLVGWAKAAGPRDAILNVLLFMPFGFGLAGLLRRRGLSRFATAAISLLAGVLLSYSVEFAQFFIPGRDSGWEDIFTNGSGSLAGCLFFYIAGMPLLWVVQSAEAAIARFSTGRNVAILLACYFAVWFGVSARLQKMDGLQDWNAETFLTVGGFANPWSTHAWKGTMSGLELWDRAIPGDAASRITSSAGNANASPGSAASYRFSGAAPFQDLQDQLPALNLKQIQRAAVFPAAGTWDGNSWLATTVPISKLVQAIQTSGQFSIHFQFTPAETGDMNASLVTIGRAGETPNLEIRQASEALAFWFRTPLSPEPFDLEWSISRGCEPNRPRNVLFSYDGSKLWAYMDGQLRYEGYRLGPATALARLVRNIRPSELQGYRYTYYGIVFFPAGCLLGFAWRKSRGMVNLLLLSLLGIIMPSVILELSLVLSGSQPTSVGNLCLAVIMSAIGMTWINAEGSTPKALPKPLNATCDRSGEK
ncbi:MAG TPA: VanZ family protein [Candidatus Acidoferrales bacterium]|nr:VanZ family protein [Candidatus Acidoferrales bacterium]